MTASPNTSEPRPRTTHQEYKLEAFSRLLRIMDDLREQCPWDRKQTAETLRNLTIEETYELADEIIKGDLNGIKEETGDLMLHMVFYAKIAEEAGAWNIGDALHAICDKLVKRHPHVYGSLHVADEEEVKKNWEQLETARKVKSRCWKASPIPYPLSLMHAAKTAQVGLEMETTEQVWEKGGRGNRGSEWKLRDNNFSQEKGRRIWRCFSPSSTTPASSTLNQKPLWSGSTRNSRPALSTSKKMHPKT
ncbi:MAG: MazG nucleotide pyrophosphohydrolase domain-containing protein [Saprospiraceae bacterium]